MELLTNVRVMQKSNISTLIGVLALAALVSFVPVTMPQAFAHQRQLYTIGNQDYLIVIGSLNEPIFVDDKSGVELRVIDSRPQQSDEFKRRRSTPSRRTRRNSSS